MPERITPQQERETRKKEAIHQFISQLTTSHQRSALRTYLRTPQDAAFFGRLFALRNGYGAELINWIGFQVNELVEQTGCSYEEIASSILDSVPPADEQTPDSERETDELPPKKPSVSMPATSSEPPEADQTGQFFIEPAPTSLSPEELAKGVTLEERGMLEALLTLDDFSDLGEVMQLADRRHYKAEKIKVLLDLANDLTRLPGNADENRGRIMAAISEAPELEDERDIPQRETAAWEPQSNLTPTLFFQMLTPEGQEMLGAYMALPDRNDENSLRRLREKYGAGPMDDIITQVKGMNGSVEEVLQEFSELLTGRKTISFNPSDVEFASQSPRTSQPSASLTPSERPTPMREVPEVAQPQRSNRPAMIKTPELEPLEEEDQEPAPVSIPVNLSEIWTQTPHPEMSVSEFVNCLTEEGQEMLRDLLNLEDIRDGTALSGLEKERGKKGHVMLAFRVVEYMNRMPDALLQMDTALAVEREDVAEMSLQKVAGMEEAPFSSRTPNDEISSPWITAPDSEAKPSNDPLGDFLDGLTAKERLQLEEDLQAGGPMGKAQLREWSGHAALVLKKMARKEKGFKEPTLILARLQAMRMAESANGPDYQGQAAFVAGPPQRSFSPWQQYATRAPEILDAEEEEGVPEQEISQNPQMQAAVREAVARTVSSPEPPAVPRPRPMLKSTNRFDNMAVAVPAHTMPGQRPEPDRKTRAFNSVIELAEAITDENEFIDDLTGKERQALEAYRALEDRNDIPTVNRLSAKHGRVFWEVAHAVEKMAERRKVSVGDMLMVLGVRLGGGDITDEHFAPKIVVKQESDKPIKPVITEEERRQKQAKTVISPGNKAKKKPSGLFGKALFGKKRGE